MRLLALIIVAGLTLQPSAIVRAQPYVPDESTAIAIAEAVLWPIFGVQLVEQIKPFTATRDGNVWRVISEPKLGVFASGGAVIVLIDRETGAIIEWSTFH